MESEVKEALDELLKLDLSEKAQQLIVNLVSALAKNGCNITLKHKAPKCRNLSVLSITPSPSSDNRIEEPGVNWSPVPCSPALATPNHNRLAPPVEGLKRQLLHTPPRTPEQSEMTSASDSNLEEAWMKLGLAVESSPSQKSEACLKEAWAELDLVIDEAYKAYCEYRARLGKAFKAYEEFCAAHMSREAIELTKKWRDFVMEHRSITGKFDEFKLRKLKGEDCSTEERLVPHYEDMGSVIKRVFDEEARAQKLEEIQRCREQQRLCRQAEIAQAAREMSLWKKEACRAERHVEATARKCKEIRDFCRDFLKKESEKVRVGKSKSELLSPIKVWNNRNIKLSFTD